MKQILKNGGSIILKLIVSQIGIAIFAFFYSFAFKDKPNVMLILCSFAVLLYMFLIFIHLWEHGAKDRIKVDGGRLNKNIFTGLILSLIANSANIILAILINVAYLSIDGHGVLPLNQLSSPDWAIGLYNVTNSIARIAESMYLGFIAVYFNESPYIFFIIIIPALAVSFFAYYCGFSNKLPGVRRIFMEKKK